VVSWELIHQSFMPDFLERYGNYLVEKQRAAGATQEQLNATVQENQKFIEMYKNPFLRLVFSMMEAFPVGLLITLISAWVLKRKPSQIGGGTAGAAIASARG
jgi:hypothetical protein